MTKKTINRLTRAGLALAGFTALQSTVIADAKVKPTFTEDIAPIIYNNCTECHRPGQAAPFTLKSYNDVKKRARLITKVTEDQYMPPWHPVEGHGKFVDERRRSSSTSSFVRRLVVVLAVGAVVDARIAVLEPISSTSRRDDRCS